MRHFENCLDHVHRRRYFEPAKIYRLVAIDTIYIILYIYI